MATQTGVNLNTNIVIGGQVTSGFMGLANRLETLGATAEKIGATIREFEKDSVQVYRSYEDNMLAAEFALSAQYTSASELERVMQGLEKHASEWAANTIFHTDDVSRAINEAAHAGWSYEQILAGIPKAMYIAQAGGMDLSSGLDYLIKMMNATGTEFDDIGKVIDQWSKASNLSATNIDEMGQAFMSLGAAAQFADSTEELFTLLAVLANVGTTGSQAGTVLRSAMVRIIAPTTKAENAMALLGADADEINEALADENVTKAAKTLQGLGFSAYDTEGNLLPLIDVFTNLHTALQGLEEQSRNEILAAIFPTRTIAAATSFISAIGNGQMAWLLNGITDSEGYAAKGAEIMMSGLTGSIETLKSKWEEFEKNVGGTLAPLIESLTGLLGSVMDAINGMDEETLNGLVGAMTSLAALGPVMLGAGGIIKAVGTLGVKGVMLGAAATAAGALAGYLTKLSDNALKNSFGDIALDMDTLGAHADSLKTIFDIQAESIEEWENAFESAADKYNRTASGLSETLLMDVLMGKTLSKADKDALYLYAQDIYDAVWDGIENAQARDMTFLEAMFGSPNTAEENEVGNAAGQIMSGWYDSLYAEAEAIGEELRGKLTEALLGDELNEEERQAIQSTIDRYNQIMAEIQSRMDMEDYYVQLYKAQSVSFDTINDYLSDNKTKQEKELQALEENYATLWARARASYDYAIANGLTFTDLEGNELVASEYDWNAFEAQFAQKKSAAQQSIIDKYGDLSAIAFDAMMNDSDYSVAWNFMKWMNQNGINPGSWTDAYGSIDYSKVNYAGMQMTPELASVLKDQFWSLLIANRADFWTGKNKLDQIISPFGDNPIISEYLSMINPHALNNMIDLMTVFPTLWNDYVKSGKDPWGVFDYTQAGAGLSGMQDQADENPLIVETEIDTTAVDEYKPPTKVMSIVPFQIGNYYAEGGRATTPSIFGEAGAEWAIPEEHSERTAELLNAARAASGFTWNDLLARYGGLNGSAGNQNVVLHYSPTINAGSADGVAEALNRDKERLMRMMQEAMRHERLRNDVEVYA